MPITVPVLRVLEACRVSESAVRAAANLRQADRQRDVYRMVARIAKDAGIP